MSSSLDFIYKRHSVRQFKACDVPMMDIEEMLKAASYAPSGKNRQNWHYVVIKDKTLIESIAQAIEGVHDDIVEKVGDVSKTQEMTKFLKYYTIFRSAPILVAAYVGPYPKSEVALLKSIGMEAQAERVERMNSGLQNVAASLENFMLAAATLGYGTCWMTGPCFASLAIEALVPFEKEGYELMAVTPLGLPASEGRSPARRPVSEIYTLIK